MRIIFTILLLFTLASSAEVKVTADNFSANEISGKGTFNGHVKVIKGEDILKSDKLIIYFNKNKKPTKYEATGNASIKVNIKGKKYFGKGNKLIYEPNSDTYKILGNAFFEDRTTDKKIYGENIKVNQKNGEYKVDSKKNEPVKFIFHVDDKQKW